MSASKHYVYEIMKQFVPFVCASCRGLARIPFLIKRSWLRLGIPGANEVGS
jgi:hypothetical protein